MRGSIPNSNDTTYLICATHGRVYLTAAEYNEFVSEYIKKIGIANENIIRKRNMIVDNTDVKFHLSNIIKSEELSDKTLNNNIINLINSDLPHYLWYTELHIKDNLMLILIGDTTYPVNTNLDIFKLAFWTSSDYQLKLLTYQKK